MSEPYRVAAEPPHETRPAPPRTTVWAKLRHWFWGIGCSHMGATSSVLHPGQNAVRIHYCDRCGDIVQIDWYVGGVLDDRCGLERWSPMTRFDPKPLRPLAGETPERK